MSRGNGKIDPQKAKLIQENQKLKELVANLSVENLVQLLTFLDVFSGLPVHPLPIFQP